MTEEGIERVLVACANTTEVETDELLARAYGSEAFALGWGRTRLYNPDGLAEDLILVRTDVLSHEGTPFATDSLDFEAVLIDDVRYCLPNFYALRDDLISNCPNCARIDVAGLTIEAWRAALEEKVERLIRPAGGVEKEE